MSNSIVTLFLHLLLERSTEIVLIVSMMESAIVIGSLLIYLLMYATAVRSHGCPIIAVQFELFIIG